VSYHIGLTIDTGGPEPASLDADWNYTSNCGPMWRAAGADLAEFHGKTAGECLPVLEAGIAELRANPAKYIAMNPENGWGSYDSLLPRLDELAAYFRRHLKATVVVSR
jgi:hypothetical protein